MTGIDLAFWLVRAALRAIIPRIGKRKLRRAVEIVYEVVSALYEEMPAAAGADRKARALTMLEGRSALEPFGPEERSQLVNVVAAAVKSERQGFAPADLETDAGAELLAGDVVVLAAEALEAHGQERLAVLLRDETGV